jgi:hypothetical protein
MQAAMLTDRYDLPLSTASSAARDAYVRGCEAKLTMYPGAIEALEPMADELERIGGSHAQLDLVRFTLLRAYLGADRPDDARRLRRWPAARFVAATCRPACQD